MEYPDCFEIVEQLVKTERTRKREDGSFQLRYPLYERWWHYADKRPELYATITGLERVFVRSRIANMHSIAAVPTTYTLNEKLVVFASDDWGVAALLRSNLHELWAREYSSTLRTDMQYTPSDCFETFPFSLSLDQLANIGERYHSHRREIMAARREGLTNTYNRFHSAHEVSHDIGTLRALHVEMDHAVAAAYGWTDLELGHGFHQTKQGIRYTISEAARREVLDRLLALNHERYAAEQSAAAVAPRSKQKPASVRRNRRASFEDR